MKCNILLIHAVFRSCNLEYSGCCTVSQFYLNQVPSPGFSLICTLFPVLDLHLARWRINESQQKQIMLITGDT